MDLIAERTGAATRQRSTMSRLTEESDKQFVIPPDRVRYLAEIVERAGATSDFVGEQVAIARRLYQLRGTH